MNQKELAPKFIVLLRSLVLFHKTSPRRNSDGMASRRMASIHLVQSCTNALDLGEHSITGLWETMTARNCTLRDSKLWGFHVNDSSVRLTRMQNVFLQFKDIFSLLPSRVSRLFANKRNSAEPTGFKRQTYIGGKLVFSAASSLELGACRQQHERGPEERLSLSCAVSSSRLLCVHCLE